MSQEASSESNSSSEPSKKSLDLEAIIDNSIGHEKPIVNFEPDCIRKRSNWSTVRNEFKFDHPDFHSEMFLKDMPDFSPKLVALLKKIEELDARDQKKYGKTFKHFIFSDIKSGGQGAKMIAAGLAASGWNMAYKAEWLNRAQYEAAKSKEKGDKKVPEPKYGPLTLLSQRDLLATRKHNFLLLSSVGVFDKPIGVQMKKSMLALFNSRPENIYGDLARIIVMDSGFKEGIDLFDIKYVHMFEPAMNAADQKQVIGRGTRTCGQKGLQFHPTQGWPLEVNIYDLEIPESLRFSLLGADTGQDLWMKAMKMDVRLANFEYDMERLAVAGSVDFELNKAVHNFQVDLLDDDADEIVLGGTKVGGTKVGGTKVGGTKVGGTKVGGTKSVSSENIIESMNSFGHEEMIKYIRDNFSKFKWENVKMENLCGEVPKEWENWEPKEPASPKVSEKESELPVLSSLSERSSISKLSTSSKSESKKASSSKLSEVSPSKETIATATLIDSKKETTPELSETLLDDYSSENTLKESPKRSVGGASSVLNFTPTQSFIQQYFTPFAPVKGMLLYHSVGTGKTCSAIAAATSNFEPFGYTILWVTRTTLKNDIWKNMFDQVCHKNIQERIMNGEVIPDVHKERMRLLSKAWRIRPMSYKQFSNLVSKKNQYYEQLVKENGEADPLQKTLLIIDEAHKLYGGNDLSSLERPDMPALHQALMNSYAVSGENSVRLLLMTATPITKHPLELVQLVNLCKPIEKQIPATFDQFASHYLTEEGTFTPSGQYQFLDQIAGHISYLNREKDARQFSQPRVKRVLVPILSDSQMNYVDDFDKFVARSQSESDVLVIQENLEKTAKKIEDELRDISKENFRSFFELCHNYENISGKKCETVIRKNVAALVREVKVYVGTMRDQLKNIRSELSKIKKGKQAKLALIAKKIKENPTLFAQYKASTYAAIRDKCSSKTLKGTKFLDAVEALPEVVEIDNNIQATKESIVMLENQLKLEFVSYKQKIKQLKELLKKPDIAPVEKTAIEYSIRDLESGFKTTKKNRTQEVQEEIKSKTNEIQAAEKHKKDIFARVRKTLKNREKLAKSEENNAKKAARALRKTMKNQESILEEIKDEEVKAMAERRKELIEYDLKGLEEEMRSKEIENQKKQEEKDRKKREIEHEKLHNINKALDIFNLLSELEKDPNKILKNDTKSPATSDVKYFFIGGQAKISEINKEYILLKNSQNDKEIKLAIKYIFGNSARDCSGLISINDFTNTMDLNNVSEEINKLIRKEIIDPFLLKVKKGDLISFTGAIEISMEEPKLSAIEIVPLTLALQPSKP
jgi:hypothetical protein